MKSLKFTSVLIAALLAMSLAACSEEQAQEASDDDPGIVAVGVDDYGRPMLGETPSAGKADSAVGRKGLPVSVDSADTAVWEVRNQWEDTDTPEAREAGIAWPANSGLDWNQKFTRWVESMRKIRGHDTYYDTFELTTPWGKTLPAPSLECAEVAIFLRVTFASWYGLPFFLEATDGKGNRLYFGHFGMRTASGRYGKTPRFKAWYRDYGDMTREDIEREGWPKDQKLRGRAIPGGASDLQPFLGEEAHAGQYFDEIFLNKRVGHFMRLLLAYFGSINLVDSANTYHIVPESIREGDMLIERWQRRGIGHVMVIKDVEPLSSDRLDAQIVSGSMPRRQPKWEDSASSKRFFTSEECGGEGTNWDGDEYARLGGGVRRWRIAKPVNGRWTNVIPEADRGDWIPSQDIERIAARPERFETLLGQPDPEELRDSILRTIEDAREHLRRYPASCSARTRREEAFAELYAINEEHFGMSREETDREYRILDDYVFAELVYQKSKTCCWNSTTKAMYEIIMDYNRSLVYDKESKTCSDPVVFKARDGGYDLFLEHARELGREDEWVAWSEDEPCSQRDVEEDTEQVPDWTPFCRVYDSILDVPQDCSDQFQGNDDSLTAAHVDAGTYEGLRICEGEEDWFLVDPGEGVEVTVRVEFTHADGDLDVKVLSRDGETLGSSTSTSDVEEVTVTAPEQGLFLEVYGYSGATNDYTLHIEY